MFIFPIIYSFKGIFIIGIVSFSEIGVVVYILILKGCSLKSKYFSDIMELLKVNNK